jgi:hypothetical protein
VADVIPGDEACFGTLVFAGSGTSFNQSTATRLSR